MSSFRMFLYTRKALLHTYIHRCTLYVRTYTLYKTKYSSQCTFQPRVLSNSESTYILYVFVKIVAAVVYNSDLS